jgi:hypothetical protein
LYGQNKPKKKLQNPFHTTLNNFIAKKTALKNLRRSKIGGRGVGLTTVKDSMFFLNLSLMTEVFVEQPLA